MTEPISDPLYWKQRLRTAKERHQSIFKCDLPTWQAIEENHRRILAETIGPTESVLDAGCGWGRLLTLLPPTYRGFYVGVDLSPDFIDLARQEYPSKAFVVADLRQIPFTTREFDWAVLISIRPMVKRNLGDDEWAKMERELRRVAKRLLFLEYDVSDKGTIE